MPALFISGTLDSNTPPSQAEEVAAGFTRAVHIIVENAGHESTLRPAEVRAAVLAFLEGKAVESGRISAPEIRFLPLDYRPRQQF